MMAEQQIQTDIVIVGAGMVGAILALAIAKQAPTLKVLLIDNNPEKVKIGEHPGFDARSIALSAGSCQLLERLGLWQAIKQKAQPIDDIHISDKGNIGLVELENSTLNMPFGYVVELQNVGVVVQQKLASSAQIKRCYNSSLASISKQQNSITCVLQDGAMIDAKLCIAADGGNSKSNQLLSIASSEEDYGCSAIIANVGCKQAHQNRAFERFTDSGPLALLPLSDNRFSLVWSVKNTELKSLLALDEVAFVEKLQQAFGYRAGIFTKAGKRDSYPLKLIKTDKPITHRGVAIGNAAHCLHPVMGQGFNLGLRDLSALATVISEVAESKEIGGFNMLNRYWLARKNDHNTTINMTDSIVRIFSSTEFPVVFGRTLALQAISLFPSLGAPIVKQAKGQFNLFINENNK